MEGLDFSKAGGLVPAIIQDETTGKVLMLGYMNEEALSKTRAEGKVTFFSRTKNRLWTKGETSDNFFFVKDIIADCDKDTLLIKVSPVGPACHTGADTCFNEVNTDGIAFLNSLTSIIKDRHNNPSDKSYTSSLFAKGINKVAQKVGEEAVEVVIEAKDDNQKLFLNESADLLFHLMILLEAKGNSLDEVVDILKQRHNK
jgi:phosphoribosyl-AMP cyclohydrolase / phosphoribosyl-ATP pyrophosphohydrolase